MNIFNEDFEKRLDKLSVEFTKISEKKNLSQDTQRLASTLKVGEEYGELSEAVLMELGHQRQSKLDRYKKEELAGEIADVIIQTLYTGYLFDIDISKAVLSKIEKVENKLSKY